MRGKKQPYIMSASELKHLKEEARENRSLIQQMERERYGEGNSRAAGMNREQALKQARQLEALAEKHSAPRISASEKDKLARKAEDLRGKISTGMLSSDEMNNTRRNPNAPMKHLEWERRNAGNIHEYKQIMRRLEPGDPGASSVERFRR